MAGEGTNKGWISIYRSIQDHWLWQEKPFSKGQAWLDLLLSANHQDKKILLGNELISVKRGSFITSQAKLMERWGWGNTKVRNFLRLLKEDNMIEYSGKKYTLIKIKNYEMYQKQTNDNSVISTDSQNTQTDSKSTTNCEQTDNKLQANTNNNDNNDNNDNNVYERDELSHSALELCEYYSNLKPGQNITQHIDTLKIWIDIYGMEWTKEALQKTVSSKGKFIKAYMEKILQNWQVEGKEEIKSGSTRKNNTEPKPKQESEGEKLARRAIEKYGDKLEDFECDF